MNATVRVAVLSLSILGLAACAGTQTKSSYVEPASAPRAESSMSRDERYIATIERIARNRGIDVVWVNPPQRESVQDE
ncbi:hypothetical protein ABU614_13340 [Lysobacter firmicutimachus]|uniref:Uncharacterized protein n=1 Tax=Lysobacter firmicutimachus TaxID=1792846 RepID=A0AAU8MP09_9GAMM|nr:hypothetical protein [Lysobacter antibioticus]